MRPHRESPRGHSSDIGISWLAIYGSQQMPTMDWYFEDFAKGMSIEVGGRCVSEKEILAFATEYDPQPFHTDPQAAAASIYGSLIASGWQTCSIMMRLVVDGFLKTAANMGSPGVDEVRWLKPLHAGDTLYVKLTVTGVRAIGSMPDRGLMCSLWEGRNQYGELLVTLRCKAMFQRRPA